LRQHDATGRHSTLFVRLLLIGEGWVGAGKFVGPSKSSQTLQTARKGVAGGSFAARS
jgi:hypothetical protein